MTIKCICGAHRWYRPFWCRYVWKHDNPGYHCTCPDNGDKDASLWSAVRCMWQGRGK